MSGSDEEKLAAELRRIREGVRDRALLEADEKRALPPVRTREPEMGGGLPPADQPGTPPPRPDGKAVNDSWNVAKVAGRGLLGRILKSALAPWLEAQTAWNARQVQLDNEILEYLEARSERTHAHYDRVLGIHGRHMEDINERHLILQEELVAHVHDLVKRIDLVLGEGEKGRLSLEFALREVRTRLTRLEERLARG